MSRVEPYAVGTWLRKKSLAKVAEHVAYEDEQTRHICIGPVNKVVNMLVRFFHDGAESEGFRRHIPRLQDYLWVAEGEKKRDREREAWVFFSVFVETRRERGKRRGRRRKREKQAASTTRKKKLSPSKPRFI